MKHLTDRRTVLLAAGTAMAAAVAGGAKAQPSDIRVTVAFDTGEAIPKGELEVYFEDTAIKDDGERRAGAQRVQTDGGAKAMEFSLSLPAGRTVTPTLEIAARLERPDGWLLARGSARVEPGTPVHVPLSTVMY